MFLSLFADRHQTFVRSRNSNAWRATSQYHYLTDEEIASAISSRSSLYRAFGNQEKTSFVVIQVQGSSNEAPVQTIKNLHKLLMQKSVKSKPYYLKELDIWQLFIFLSAPTPTSEATTAIRNWLSTSWFTLDSETIDVLPNQSPMPVPLQADFTWLNDDYESILSSSEISLENAASLFLRDLSDCKNSLESLNQLLAMDDQIGQPAYADEQCLIEQSAATEEPLFNPNNDKNHDVVLGSPSFTHEQLDIVVPSASSAEEPVQLDVRAESVFSASEKFGATFDEVVSPLLKLTESLIDCQVPEQSTDQGILSNPGAGELNQSAYSVLAEVANTAISLMESPTAPELELLPTIQPDQPASIQFDKMQTNMATSLEEETAYAAVSPGQSQAESESKMTPAKETSKYSNMRERPPAKQKGRPTIRSNLDSFEQLTLPFGSNTS